MGVEGCRVGGAEWEARTESARVQWALKRNSLVEVSSRKHNGVHAFNHRTVLQIDVRLVDALDLCDDTNPLRPLEIGVVNISSRLVSITERLVDRASAARIAVVEHGKFSRNVRTRGTTADDDDIASFK